MVVMLFILTGETQPVVAHRYQPENQPLDRHSLYLALGFYGVHPNGDGRLLSRRYGPVRPLQPGRRQRRKGIRRRSLHLPGHTHFSEPVLSQIGK